MEKVGTRFEVSGVVFDESQTYEIVRAETIQSKEGRMNYYYIEVTNRETGEYLGTKHIEKGLFRKLVKMGCIEILN